MKGEVEHEENEKKNCTFFRSFALCECLSLTQIHRSIGAVITMAGTFYTGYKGLNTGHKYFAFGSLICMIMAVFTGHKMIPGPFVYTSSPSN